MTDDDCLMNVNKVYNVFNQVTKDIDNTSEKLFCGFEYGVNRKPIRAMKSKWYNCYLYFIEYFVSINFLNFFSISSI